MTTTAKTYETKIQDRLNLPFNLHGVEILIRILYNEVEGRPLAKSLTPRFALESIYACDSWDDAINFMLSDKWQIDTKHYQHGPRVHAQMKELLKPFAKVEPAKPEVLPDPPAEITIESDNDILSKSAIDAKVDYHIQQMHLPICVDLAAAITDAIYNNFNLQGQGTLENVNWGTIQLAIIEGIMQGAITQWLSTDTLIEFFNKVPDKEIGSIEHNWITALEEKIALADPLSNKVINDLTILLSWPAPDLNLTVYQYTNQVHQIIKHALYHIAMSSDVLHIALLAITRNYFRNNNLFTCTPASIIGDIIMQTKAQPQQSPKSEFSKLLGDSVYNYAQIIFPSYEYAVHFAECAGEFTDPRYAEFSAALLTQLAVLSAIIRGTLVIGKEDISSFARLFMSTMSTPNYVTILSNYMNAHSERFSNLGFNTDECRLKTRMLITNHIDNGTRNLPEHLLNNMIENTATIDPKFMAAYQWTVLSTYMNYAYNVATSGYTPRPVMPVQPGIYQDPNLFHNPAPHGAYPTQPPMTGSVPRQAHVQYGQPLPSPTMAQQPMRRNRKMPFGGSDMGYHGTQVPRMQLPFGYPQAFDMFGSNPYGTCGGRRMDMFASELTQPQTPSTEQTSPMHAYVADRTVNQGVAMVQLLEEVAELNKQIDEKIHERQRLLKDVEHIARDLVFLNKE